MADKRSRAIYQDCRGRDRAKDEEIDRTKENITRSKTIFAQKHQKEGGEKMTVLSREFFVQTEAIVKYDDRYFRIHDKGIDWWEYVMPRFSITELEPEDESDWLELEDIEKDTELFDTLLDEYDDIITEGHTIQMIANKQATPMVESDIVGYGQAIERVVMLGKEVEFLDALSIMFDKDKAEIVDSVNEFKKRVQND